MTLFERLINRPPLFASKAEAQAVRGKYPAGMSRAYTLHAMLTRTTQPTPTQQPEAPKRTRAELAAAAQQRINAREDALYNKLFGGAR